MSKHEDPIILKYWNEVGGTLCKDFKAVQEGKTRRTLDAVILPDRPKVQVHWKDISLRDQNVIVVQAKAKPLSMYLMGQTLFSAELVKTEEVINRFGSPRSIRSIALCKEDVSILHRLLISIGEQVGVDIKVKEYPDAKLSPMSEGPGSGGRKMIDWYWRNAWKDKGYTLEKNVQVVNETDTNAQQTAHAVIRKGRSIIVMHAKAGGNKKGKYQPYRLGMYLMGQALFGAELVRQKLRPRSIRSVALCEKDDSSILNPMLKDIGKKVGIDIEVVEVPEEVGTG